MSQWGPPYVGATAFWVNGRDLLVLTSRFVAVRLLGASVFNGDKNYHGAKFSETLTDRTMLLRMHPSGRHPELAEETAPLLLTLCQASSKDQCLARLLWYVSSMPRESKTKLLNDLCTSPVLLSHPFRHVLHTVYCDSKYYEAVWSREMYDQLELASPLHVYDDYDIKIPSLAPNVLGELAQARIIYDEGGRCTWPGGVIPSPDAEIKVIGDLQACLDETWAHIHVVDLEKDSKSDSCHRLFANTYSSANHLAMRGELLLRALRQTAGWQDADRVGMVLGRVHPYFVPVPATYKSGWDDELVTFQIAQGSL